VIRKLSEGVLVVWEDGAATSTIITGKGCSIVVDTSLFPEKAEKIEKFAREIGGPVRYVVNTHYHPDHTFGNCAFKDAEIISSSKTKESMDKMDMDYIRRVWGDLADEYHISIPNITFEDEKVFQLCGVKIFLKRLGGHTPDSTIVFLEREGILIAGDLIFNGYHAEITHDSDLDTWISALSTMRKMSPMFVVPGHGEPGGIEVISQMKEYMMKVSMIIEGKIGYEDLVADENFKRRDFPELFSYSLENLLKIGIG